MNPFDWRGPAFLLFFAGLSAIAITFLIVYRRVTEDGPPTNLDLSDPYLLAYLRAGAKEAVCVGIVSLLDRELLVADEETLRWNRPDADRFVRRPIERELLDAFKAPRDIRDVLSKNVCQNACDEYAQTLTTSGALPNDDVRSARRTRLAVVFGVLLVVASIKILIGLSRNAPVGFLFAMTAAASVVAALTYNPFRTRRGDRLLADAQLLFAGLRSRAATLRGGRGDSDVTMLAAVFGVGALPSGEFPFVAALFPRAHQRAQSGTGCGASCSSGSSSSCSGGGGGSGCGGCGGGGD